MPNANPHLYANSGGVFPDSRSIFLRGGEIDRLLPPHICLLNFTFFYLEFFQTFLLKFTFFYQEFFQTFLLEFTFFYPEFVQTFVL